MPNGETPWSCPSCRTPLGYVAFGELIIDEGVEVGKICTDGPDINIMCPSCKSYKTWYSNDRLSQIMRILAVELKRELARS